MTNKYWKTVFFLITVVILLKSTVEKNVKLKVLPSRHFSYILRENLNHLTESTGICQIA